jgi:2-oxo-4-hydroxy-4-carboxy-5-ureidoimidazoline decarboxylase
MTLAELNGMGVDEFRRALGGVFEHSPWIAERAWAARPFTGVEDLHAAMVAVVRRASGDERLTLLRAHPDLAGKAARAGAMTAASVGEQASAGLDRLSDEDYEDFARLNTAYRAKFGFPFIIAVRQHDTRSILAAFEARLPRTVEEEIEAALAQVFTITRRRLEALFETR